MSKTTTPKPRKFNQERALLKLERQCDKLTAAIEDHRNNRRLLNYDREYSYNEIHLNDAMQDTMRSARELAKLVMDQLYLARKTAIAFEKNEAKAKLQ